MRNAAHVTGVIGACVFAAGALLVACAVASPSEQTSPDAFSTQDVPCDVDLILSRRCRQCHDVTPKFGAPMALISRDQLIAPSTTYPGQRVLDRIIARVHDDAHPMPQPPNPRLSAQETQALEAWRDAGAPKSLMSQACVTGPVVDAPVSACDPDMKLVPPAPWTMPQTHDQYVCYGVDVQPPTDRHVVTFKPIIDNEKLLHHIVLLVSDNPTPSEPTPCSPVAQFAQRVVYAWAPGGKGLTLPADVGFELPASKPTHFVVQLHYNNATNAKDEKDSSGVGFCTDTPRGNIADVVAFGTHSIYVPPRSDVARSCDYKIPQNLDGRHFFAVFPHMHQNGTAISMSLTHRGSRTDLGTVDRWDFQNQPWLSVDAVGALGDVMNTRCAYTNPTDRGIKFGENTADEMCYLFTMYYPRNTEVSWVAPALLSTCQSN